MSIKKISVDEVLSARLSSKKTEKEIDDAISNGLNSWTERYASSLTGGLKATDLSALTRDGQRYLDYFKETKNSSGVSQLQPVLDSLQQREKSTFNTEKNFKKISTDYNENLPNSEYVKKHAEESKTDYIANINLLDTTGAAGAATYMPMPNGKGALPSIEDYAAEFKTKDEWKPEWKQKFLELYQSDPEQAVKFAGEANRALELGEAEEFGRQHWFLGGLASVPLNLVGALDFGRNVIEYAGGKMMGKDVELERSYATDMSNAIRRGGAESEDIKWEINIGDKKYNLGGFLYNVGLSVADMAVASYAGGGVNAITSKIASKVGSSVGGKILGKALTSIGSGSVLGLSAASSTMNDVLDRGGTDAQALTSGLVAGAFETLFESLSIGELKSMGRTSKEAFKAMIEKAGKGNVKTLFKRLGVDALKSMGTNATEEAATELANILYDSLVNGDVSNYAIMVENYMKEDPTLTEEEARDKAIKQFTGQVLESAASGAIMGLFLGNGATVKAYMGAKSSVAAEDAAIAKQTNAISKPLSSYPVEKQTRIRSFVGGVDEKIKSFVNNVKNGDLTFKRQKISDVSERAAGDIKNLLDIDVSGYTHNINTNGVQHIINRHGANGQQDSSMAIDDDIARIGWVLDNYDNVELLDENGVVHSSAFMDRNNRPAPQIRFVKKIDGTYYVVEAAFDNDYKKLWVQSAYLEKNKEDVTQASADGNATDHEANAQSALASPSSDSTVTQRLQSVKNNISSLSGNNALFFNLSAANSKGDIIGDAIAKSSGVPNLTDDQKLLRKIGSSFGAKIKFDDLDYIQDGEVISPEGEYDPDTNTITLNTNVKDYHRPVQFILKHELTHSLEKAGVDYEKFMAEVELSEEFQKYARSRRNEKTGEYFKNEAEWYEYIIQKYADAGKPLGNETEKAITAAKKEAVADFVADILFDGRVTSLENLLVSLQPETRKGFIECIKEFFEKLKEFCVGKPELTEIQQLEQRFLEVAKKVSEMNAAEAEQQKTTTENGSGVKHSIITLDSGKSYVKASRRVITGKTVAEQRKEITGFFNESLKNGPIEIETVEGDVLTISKDTAEKARSNAVTETGITRKLSNEEFLVKMNAEAHIDELAEISTKNKKPIVPDTKNHDFAKDGFTYRTVYFQDFDNSYYKITLSVGENNGVSTIYNVGKIKTEDIPDGNIISTIGSKADMSSVRHSIPENEQPVNNNYMRSGKKYSIAGPKSHTANLENLEKAKERDQRLKDTKANSENTRRKYGWFRGLDRMWRYEISDREAEVDLLNPEYKKLAAELNRLSAELGPPYNVDAIDKLDEVVNAMSKIPRYRNFKVLGDILKHDKLYEAYPELRNYKVKFAELKGGSAEFDSSTKTIRLNKDAAKTVDIATIMHEVQHAIQDIEGFASGSSQEYWKSIEKKHNEKIRDISETLKEIESRGGEKLVDLAHRYLEISARVFENDASSEQLQREREGIEAQAKLKGSYRLLQKLLMLDIETRALEKKLELFDSDYDRYYNTAGEIEARNVEERLRMTDDERETTRPDIDRKKVAFVEGKFRAAKEITIGKKRINTVDIQNQVRDIGNKLGRKVKFIDMEKWARENGKKEIPEGFYNPLDDTIYIGYQTERAVAFLFKHELTHFGENSPKYNDFVKAVIKSKAYAEWLSKKTGMDKSFVSDMQSVLMARARKNHEGLDNEFSDEKQKAEVIADFVGEMLFGDSIQGLESMLNRMPATERNAFVQYILDFFSYMKKRIIGYREITLELSRLEDSLKKLIEDANNSEIDVSGGKRYFYAGKESLTANKEKLEQAKRREKSSDKEESDSENIRRELDWFRGMEPADRDKWKYEIDDSEAKLKNWHKHIKYVRKCRRLALKLNRVSAELSLPYDAEDMKKINEVLDDFLETEKELKGIVLGDIFEHDKLYEAYPKLYNTKVEFSDKMNSKAVSEYDPNEDIIRINAKRMNSFNESIMLEEIQHKIQLIEKFSEGSSIDFWMDVWSKIIEAENMARGALAEIEQKCGKRFVRLAKRYVELERKYAQNDKSVLQELEDIAEEAYDNDVHKLFSKYYSYRQYVDERLEKIGYRMPEQLYEDTAGEIEAHDVGKRWKLSKDERKEKRPDIDRTDFVRSEEFLSPKEREKEFAFQSFDSQSGDQVSEKTEYEKLIDELVDSSMVKNAESRRKNELDFASDSDIIENNAIDFIEANNDTQSEILVKNKIQGRTYEKQEFAKFSSQNSQAVEQITIITASGIRTRVDAVGINENGNVVIHEFKSSATAALTKNQRSAFPEIVESGGVIVGKGKGIFYGGYQIPAGTSIKIIRPE